MNRRGSIMRRLALVMALIMLCTSLNGITLTAFAEGVESITEKAVEAVLDREDVDTAILEEVLLDEAAEEAVIMDEDILLVEEIEELDVTDEQSPVGDIETSTEESENGTIPELQMAESIQIENTDAVEEINEELLTVETVADGAYIGSTNRGNAPIVDYAETIVMQVADETKIGSWNYIKFMLPEDEGGEYAVTALSEGQSTDFDLWVGPGKELISAPYDYETAAYGTGRVLLAGGYSYGLSYYYENSATVEFRITKVNEWEQVKMSAEPVIENEITGEWTDDSQIRVYKYVVQPGWERNTYADPSYWCDVDIFDENFEYLGGADDELELIKDQNIYLYVTGGSEEYEYSVEIRNKLQEAFARAEELSTGFTYIDSGDDSDDLEMYRFTAEEDGEYLIENFADMYFYFLTESGYERVHAHDSYSFELKEGETCYLGFYGAFYDEDWDEYEDYFEISLIKIRKLWDLSVSGISSIKDSYYEKIEEVDFRVDLKLCYDDETTDSIRVYSSDQSEWDESGNKIEVVWYKDGELYTGSRYYPSAGNYEMKFSCNEIVSEDTISFTVLSLNEVEREVIVGTKNEIVYSDRTRIVKFTPSVTGTYVIQADGGIQELSVNDKEGEYLSGNYDSDGSVQISAYLHANTVYYFELTARKNSTVNLWIESRPIIKEAAVVVEPGAHYAGTTRLAPIIQVKLTYGDGTTKTVDNSDTDSYGNLMECYLLDSEGERDYDSVSWGYHNAGTYTIYPSICSENDELLEVYIPEKLVSADVTLTIPDASDLPALTADMYEQIPGGLTKKWYTFTAVGNGTYSYEEEVTDSVIDVEFYTVGENKLEGGKSSVYLEENESCFVAVSTYTSTKIKIVNTDLKEVELPKTELPEVLELDCLYHVELEEGERVSAAFTPSEDGIYVLESSNNKESDPYVYLSLAEDDEDDLESDYNNYDNNSGVWPNFRLGYYLKAGMTYKYEMKDVDNDGGSFFVCLQRADELVLNQPYHPSNWEEITVSVTFTPTEDGFYVLEGSSKHSGAHPDIELYVAESGKRLENTYGEKLVYFLKAGIMYEYRLDENADSYSVLLTRMEDGPKTIKNIEFIIDEDHITEWCTTYDGYIDLKLIYHDGSTQIIHVGYDDYDNYNSINYKYEPVSETETYVNYKATVTWYNTLIEGDEIKTADAVFSSKKVLPVLQLNKTVNAEGDWIDHDYQFTPQESGEYIMRIKRSTRIGADNCDVNIWALDEGNATEVWTTIYGKTMMKGYLLEAGTTYHISIFSYLSEHNLEYELIKGSTVKSFEIINKPYQDTVFPGTYVVSMDGLEAKITYENGEQETVAYGATDSFGRKFSVEYTWINDQTFGVEVQFVDRAARFTIPAGTKDMSNMVNLQEGVSTNFNGLALFTPERSAAYQVYTSYSDVAGDGSYDFCVYDMNGKTIENGENDTGIPVYWLEQGQTYLAAYGDPNITVSALVFEEGKGSCIWEIVSETNPTCTTAGELKERCILHGEERSKVTPAVGHNYTQYISQAATCERNGLKTFTCTRKCGLTDAVYTEIIPKAAHVIVDIPSKAATCTETGLTEGKRCSVCNAVTKAQTTMKAKGHVWNAWTETEATVFSEGNKMHKCTVCQTIESVKTAEKLEPTIHLTASKIILKTKQSTKNFKVTGLAVGDSITSMKLAKNKSVKISAVNLEDGTCKLTARSKTGKAKLTITLASGLQRTVNITVQKSAVKATSIKVESKKIALKVKQKLTLKPEVQPFTCTDKITYKSSNKKIVTVSNKGMLKGIKAGKAKITIQAGKKKVTVNVTVNKK